MPVTPGACTRVLYLTVYDLGLVEYAPVPKQVNGLGADYAIRRNS